MALTRRLLYILATSSAFERRVRALQPVENLAYSRAKRYVGGRTLAEALRVSERLHDAGLATSLDFFGESETDPDALRRIVQVYRETARALTTTSADIFLEIVPSHLGLDLDAETYVQNVQRIVEVLPPNTKLHISAEESWRTTKIIETTLILADAGAPVIQTLQANLLRSESDAETLAREKVAIRLVKGAYVEPPGIARPWGDETDVAYVRLAHEIHAAGTQIILGTHDPVIAESLLAALPGASGRDASGRARDCSRRSFEARASCPDLRTVRGRVVPLLDAAGCGIANVVTTFAHPPLFARRASHLSTGPSNHYGLAGQTPL